MKLRIEADAVRLRLQQSDVSRFAETGRLEEVLRFGTSPGQQFVYTLRAVDGIEALDVRYHQGHLTLLVPARQVRGWAESDRVGFEGTYRAPGGATVRLAVEKDLQCRHHDGGERDVDASPHPEAEA